MLEPNIPKDESKRQKALESYEVLDSTAESDYDEITKLAAQISGKKIALISLIDNDRQWFKSKHGLNVCETPRSISFCAHAINHPEQPFIINNSRLDPRFSDNPLVTGDPHVIFYAGIPLTDHDGFCLGTLCVIDDEPGELSPEQVNMLKALSNNIVSLLTLRRKNLELSKEKEKMELLQQKIELLSRFPDENPNPVLRVDYNIDLIYHNKSARTKFLSDFGCKDNQFPDEEFYTLLNKFIETKEQYLRLNLERNGKLYDIQIVNVFDFEYLNLYVSDVSEFTIKTAQLKEFYETILDYFPVDIGVFSDEHRYLYVNKEGIRNDEVRSFMIGKTDYDYCDFRNLPYDMADVRRARFNQAKKESRTISWEDEYSLPDGQKKIVQRQFSPVRISSTESFYMVGYGVDITPIKNAQIELNEQFEFMKLLSEIATSFVGADQMNFFGIVKSNLEKIGKYLRSDRSYFFTYDQPMKVMELQAEWIKEGIQSHSQSHGQIPLEVLPEWRFESHMSGLPVMVEDTSSLKENLYKEELTSLNVKSFYSYPCMSNNECIGFIGIDFTSDTVLPSEREKLLLLLFSQIVSNGYTSIKNLENIYRQNALITEMNSDLELRVSEKTAENQELTEMMANLDKMAMVGELTANITHDLNSPIGSVKAASESISYTLKKMFFETLGQFSSEDLKWVYSREIQGINLSVSILQTIQERENWKKILVHEFQYNENDIDLITDGLIKCRVMPTEKELLKYLLVHQQKHELLQLMYDTLIVRSFNESIFISAERASDVIKNLRFYIKEGHKETREEIVLKESISTVLRVFQHQLNKGIHVQIIGDTSLKIWSYQSKLYQIWSNIIKNAIDAIENEGNIEINLFEENGKTHVTISNDGPTIPPEQLSRIFNKFFTTKDKSYGTGLGLNIVKEIIDEHNGEIFVESKVGSTTFHIIF